MQTKPGCETFTSRSAMRSPGNVEERARRKVLGAPESGDQAKGFFNHSTGEGYIPGTDWRSTAKAIKPDYRDSIERGNPPRLVCHDTYGAWGEEARGLLGECGIRAKSGKDGTDYARSNAKGSFVAHWSRRIALAILLAVGSHITHIIRVEMP